MGDDYLDEPVERSQAAERAHRREERRRRVRRQRLLAGAALVVAGAALVALIASMAGGSGGSDREPAPSSPQQHPGHARTGKGEAAGEVRNATPQPGWKPYTGPVPILEYHVLGRPQTEVPYPDLYVPRASFRKQMDWLDRQGYEAVTLEAVEEAWYHGGTLPPKPVVLSFDDGYRPQYTFALPTLRKHGWPGVLNLKAEGSDLYESNVKAMLEAGWELAAHTIHHSDLTTLEGEALEEEVAGSRRLLQREYGVPVKDFCYPSGRFDETVVAAVEAAGYVGATTEIPGFATKEHPYELARIEVLGSWTVRDLAEALRG
ncbi:MAG TPA: polysaccharide deacetylase family protein [Solirubrobacterales bacterium]|nr:polysaccharide deacetylase family protein [Solirubrobacterales bacterium]